MISDGVLTLDKRGPDRVSPFLIPHMIPDAASGMVAIQYGIRGPNMAIVSACATGGHAVGEAMESIARGQAGVMLGAGTDAVVVPLAIAGFGQMRALGAPVDPDTGEYNPAIASRRSTPHATASSCPRAAVLVLEELEHARRAAQRRSPKWSATARPPMRSTWWRRPRRVRATNAMRAALERAGVQPSAVDYINAHGTSTPLNDRYESMAIEAVFGEHARNGLAISSSKGMTGHMMGAAGAFEVQVCVKAIQTGCLPPTINFDIRIPT